VSVTNALASRLDVTVWRDGRMHTIGFGDGDVTQPLKSMSAKGTNQLTAEQIAAQQAAEKAKTLTGLDKTIAARKAHNRVPMSRFAASALDTGGSFKLTRTCPIIATAIPATISLLLMPIPK
jgi:hypothetical protein